MPKYGSWVAVAIVYGLWAAVLFMFFRFARSFHRYADLVEVLNGRWSPGAEGAALASELRIEVLSEATLLGAMVLVAVTLGGALFLHRSRYLERLLADRAAEIEAVDRSRRLFFATASHEMRTPVTAIRTDAEIALMDHEADLRAMQEAFGHIIANAKFLGHRIEEMIGLAQTADGKLHLDAEGLDFREVVAGAVDDARFFAASAEVALLFTAADQPVHVVGDGLWLKRAVLAVIENALKFSPTGGQVGIELTETESDARVVVTDHGPGIYPDELPLVFDAYYQTRSGKERGGSGLGLAMTRWVVEQHGGKAFARNVGGYGRSRGCAVTLVVRREREA